MSATRENLVCQKRHKLEEVLPLGVPYSINIDPCNICNFKCKFCAIQTSGETLSFQKEMMPLSLFKKIIDDLSEFPNKLKVLGIVGNGEPLLNPEFPQMVRYAKDRGVSQLIETNTNGSKLTPELNQVIIDSGLDRIRISVEAVDANGYYEIAGAKIDFKEFIANIKDLHNRSVQAGGSCEVYIKTVDAAVETPEKKERFYALFENVCDRIFIDHIIPLWADWDEIEQRFDIQSAGVHGQELRPVQVCPYPFYSLCVTPDGCVVPCCADWKRELIIGDLKKRTMMEIWNSKELTAFWTGMLSGRKEHYPMCKKCRLPIYDRNDDIDLYAKDILKRIQVKTNPR